MSNKKTLHSSNMVQNVELTITKTRKHLKYSSEAVLSAERRAGDLDVTGLCPSAAPRHTV